jgi:hypothetical protein
MPAGASIRKIRLKVRALAADGKRIDQGAKPAMALSRTLRKRCQAPCCAVSWPPRFVSLGAMAVHVA